VLRGRPASSSLQPLLIVHAAEALLSALISRGARVRVLFQGALAGLCGGVQYGLLRDLLRYHLVLCVSGVHDKLYVDDYEYECERGSEGGRGGVVRLRTPPMPVQHVLAEGEDGQAFHSYLHYAKPSAFLLDVDVGDAWGASAEREVEDEGAGGGAGGHKWAANILRKVEAFHILTSIRLPVILFEGHSPLGRLEFASSRVFARVQWPFASAHDAQDASIRSAGADLVSAVARVAAAVSREGVLAQPQVREDVRRALIEAGSLTGAAGWGLLAATAATLLVARQSPSPSLSLSLESFLLHASLLTTLPLHHRALSKDALQALGGAEGELDADGILSQLRSALHVMMQEVREAGEAPMPLAALLAASSPSTLCDAYDVRTWRAVHGLLKLAVVRGNGTGASAVVASLFGSANSGAATATLSLLSSVSQATGASFALIAGPPSYPPEWGMWAATVPDALARIAAQHAELAALAMEPPAIRQLSTRATSFLRVALGDEACASLEGLGRRVQAPLMESAPGANVYFSDAFHFHSMRILRTSRRPRELRLSDAMTISTRTIDLGANTDISTTSRALSRSKWELKRIQKEAMSRNTVAGGMRGAIIQKYTITVRGEETAAGDVNVGTLVLQSCGAFKQFVKAAEEAGKQLDRSRKEGEKKAVGVAFAALAKYGSDSIVTSCQYVPPGSSDGRCTDSRPDIPVDVRNKIDRPKGEKGPGGRKIDPLPKAVQAAHMKALETALKPAQDSWDAWRSRDLEHAMGQLSRQLDVWKALPEGERGETAMVSAELYHSAEALLERFWPSLHAALGVEGGLESPRSWPELQAAVARLQASTMADVLAVRTGLVKSPFQDVFCGKDRKSLRTIVDSDLLPALLAVAPSAAVAARVTLAILYVAAGVPRKNDDAPSKVADSYVKEMWEKPKATWEEAVKGRPGAATAPFPSFAEWQLEGIPQFLLRPQGADDARVRLFRPDTWQRTLLDAIDAHKSALVSVPTSAGKTMISFYAMEEVLRRGDDDVIVYVAPTKALCDQVAAEVEARFEKVLPSSRALVGLFVADKRYDEERSQVLVCVPQTLEILLLSAKQQGWAGRVRRVIFDEVHNAVTENGDVWERLLLYVPGSRVGGGEFGDCRILALSATIGDFSSFAGWLKKVEAGRETTLITIGGPDDEAGIISRWNDLRTLLYCPPSDVAAIADRRPGIAPFTRVHPVASLDSGRLGHAKPALDIHLLPEESLELWRVLNAQSGSILRNSPLGASLRSKIAALGPSTFSPTARITMRAAHDWGRALLGLLDELADADSRATASLLTSLRGASEPTFEAVDDGLRGCGQRRYVTKALPGLVESLRSSDMLPAIAFHMSRDGCAALANVVAQELLTKEDAYRAGAQFGAWREKKEAELSRAVKEMAAAEARAQVKGVKRKDEDSAPGEQQASGDAAVDLKRAQVAQIELQLLDADSGYVPFSPTFTLFPEADGRAPPTLAELKEVTKKDLRDEVAKELAKLRVLPPGSSGRLKALKWSLLLRGIGMHHGGNAADYRGAVEFFFRRKQLRFVVATSTLAQGINMPCRTVVLAGDSHFIDSLQFRQMCGRAGRRGFDLRGNVVLFGLPSARILHHLSAVLPGMTPSNPVTASQVLRLAVRFDAALRPDMYKDDGGDDTEGGEGGASEEAGMARALLTSSVLDVVGGVRRLMRVGMALHTSPSQAPISAVYLHFHLAFLQAHGLLNEDQRPLPLAGIPTHLHYCEPGNVLFCALLQSNAFARLLGQLMDRHPDTNPIRRGTGAIRTIDPSVTTETLARDFGLLHVLAFLFKRDAPTSLGNDPATRATTTIRLTTLPPYIADAVRAFNSDALGLFNAHLRGFTLQHLALGEGGTAGGALPPATSLPISGVSFPSSGPSGMPCPGEGVGGTLGSLSLPLLLRSPFGALQGDTSDAFRSLADAADGLRPGLSLDPTLIPVLEEELAVSRWVVDVYSHGVWSKLTNVYGVDDDIQYEGVDRFLRTLKAVAVSLSLRWWSLFTTQMRVPLLRAGLPAWGALHSKRWASPETFHSDIAFVLSDIEARVAECGMFGEEQEGFRARMRVLTLELPVVQAFRGLALRYGRVVSRMFGKDYKRKRFVSKRRGAPPPEEEVDPLRVLRDLDESVFGGCGPAFRTHARGLAAAAAQGDGVEAAEAAFDEEAVVEEEEEEEEDFEELDDDDDDVDV
jgi:hypothetical protein